MTANDVVLLISRMIEFCDENGKLQQELHLHIDDKEYVLGIGDRLRKEGPFLELIKTEENDQESHSLLVISRVREIYWKQSP